MQTTENERWSRLMYWSDELRGHVHNMIYSYLRPFVTTEEILNETLQYAAERPHQWQDIPQDRLIFYLRRMAFYKVQKRVDLYKKAYKPTDDEPLAKKIAVAEGPEQKPSQVKTLHRIEKKRAAERILSKIHYPVYEQVLRMVWLEEMTVKEVAHKLGKSVNATYVTLQRAMEACRRIARRSSFAGFNISGETL